MVVRCIEPDMHVELEENLLQLILQSFTILLAGQQLLLQLLT